MAAPLEGSTCRIQTIGRRSGKSHAVSTWFAVAGNTVYVGSRRGADGDWVRNALAQPTVTVSAGRPRRSASGPARLVTDPAEVERALDAMAGKYERHASIVRSWRAAPPVFVAVDLEH